MPPTMNEMNNQAKSSSLALNTRSEQQLGQSRTSPLVREATVGAKAPSSVTSAPINSSSAHESPDLIRGTSRPTLPSTIIQSAYGWFAKRIDQWRKSYWTHIPKQPVSFATENPSTFAISTFLLLSILSGQPKILYGILCVLACHIFWISLRWSEYILEDPELRNFWKFAEGWSSFAIHQTQRVLHRGKSAKDKRTTSHRRQHEAYEDSPDLQQL